jgi:hypothetical protein
MNPTYFSTGEYSSNLSIKDKEHSLENRGGAKALVVNCSDDYNLASEKIANWLKRNGHEVVKEKGNIKNIGEFDVIYLSALYTWDLPHLIKLARQASPESKIEIGGPAASTMVDYVFAETGVKPKFGLDERFDLEPGRYLSTYTSRGCIRNCEFCSVPLVEGKLREVPGFHPAPVVLDPNFLACSKKHIENACEKLSRLPSIDFLHGLDARLLKSWHIELLLKKLNIACWRFTFDSLKNESALNNTLEMLKDYGVHAEEKIIVYCIYGYKDKPKDIYERIRLVANLKAHPYGMRFQPLDALKKDAYIAQGWDEKSFSEFYRFCNLPTLRWLSQLLKRKRKTNGR